MTRLSVSEVHQFTSGEAGGWGVVASALVGRQGIKRVFDALVEPGQPARLVSAGSEVRVEVAEEGGGGLGLPGGRGVEDEEPDREFGGREHLEAVGAA